MGEIVAEETSFASQAGPIEGWIARPAASGRYPALVLLSGIGGMGPQYRAVAEQFAEEGIVGVALNWMMREKDPPDGTVLQDIDACARFLAEQSYVDPEKITLGGYCRGGTLALLGLGQLPHFGAGVIFHGDPFYVRDKPHPFDMTPEKRPFEPFELADRYNMPLLLLHGASDTVVPVEQVYRFAGQLNELGKDFELKLYSGTGHAFTLAGEAGGRWWHAEHAEDAFRETVLFLRRVYGLPVGTVESPRIPGATPRVGAPA
jgi:carboxymethylenebutenolidase